MVSESESNFEIVSMLCFSIMNKKALPGQTAWKGILK